MLPDSREQFKYQPGFFKRTVCTVSLIVFAVAVFLSFSLFINFVITPTPAQALLGVGDQSFVTILPPGDVTTAATVSTAIGTAATAIITGNATAIATAAAKQTIWQMIGIAAKVALITFMSNLIVQMMKKLESLHVIKNFLLYSDALGFDKYIGSELNKYILQPITEWKEGDDPANQNLGAIVAQGQTMANLSEQQMVDLANAPPSMDTFDFSANPPQINKGEPTTLTWEVRAEPSYQLGPPKLNNQTVNASGNITVSPQQSTAYILDIYDANGVRVDSGCVEVRVNGTAGSDCSGRPVIPKGGLTTDQEKKLLRGAIATLTSQVACGNVNPKVIVNTAVYNAAKARGTDPRKIDPSSGNFYTDMYKMGNPYASPDFQMLAMRDTAATVESRAQTAANQELTSNGQKSLIAADKNGITRSSQTIANILSQSVGALFNLSVSASDANSFAGQVGKILGNVLFQVIFQNNGNGRLIMENGLCGIGAAAAQNINAGGALGFGGESQVSFTVNQQEGIISITPPQTVAIEWNFQPTPDDQTTYGATVKVKGLPATCVSTTLKGSCVDTPTTDKTYELDLIKGGQVIDVFYAGVTIFGAQAAVGDGTLGGQTLNLSPSFKIRE